MGPGNAELRDILVASRAGLRVIMNPLGYRIRVDPLRVTASLSQVFDSPNHYPYHLDIAYSLLFVNRGRTLENAFEDARAADIVMRPFLDQVYELIKMGLVELDDDSREVFLPLRPRGLLDRLAGIKKQRSRSSADRTPAD